MAPMLEESRPEFPFLALLVSGGHTQLWLCRRRGTTKYWASLWMMRPARPLTRRQNYWVCLIRAARRFRHWPGRGEPDRFCFPRPMTDRPGLDFSFSGLKTAALHTIRRHADDEQTRGRHCPRFVDGVVDTLMIKCHRAMEETGWGAGGRRGVSANRQLRASLEEMVARRGGAVFYPRPEFCTDNGAMIAYAGCLRLKAGVNEPLGFVARPRWPLTGSCDS